MLKIQEFINQHENWRELLSAAPYNLKISEDNGFVLFKYNQISSDFSQEICKEARGIILDSQNNFKVVRLAFYKFFNLGEQFAAHVDWDSAVSNEKLDGSLMSVWFARGQWHLSTNGVIDAFKAEVSGMSPYKTFGELFESVLPLSWFQNNISNRLTHFCYTFELVSPYTRVVLEYPETKVYLLSIRHIPSLVEMSLEDVEDFGKRFNLTTPQHYHFTNEQEYCQLVSSMEEGHEGIVVRDKFDNRVKIKTPLYFQLHRMANNGNITLERIIELILTNEQEEFLCYFQQYKSAFEAVQKVIEKIKFTAHSWDAANYKNNYVHFSDKVAKKNFSIEFAQHQSGGYKAMAYKAWDNCAEKWLASLTANQWKSLFREEFSVIG